MADLARLRVGVIGCGGVGVGVHLPVLLGMPGVEVRVLADADPARLEHAHSLAPRSSTFTDWQSAIAAPGLDAVFIALPTALHGTATRAACSAGRHVYVEKPLGDSLADARATVREWRDSGVLGMVGFNYRFNPLITSAATRLRRGDIGRVVAARTVFTTPGSAEMTWRQSRTSGGGVLLDLASHHFDLLRWLLADEMQSVSAEVRSHAAEQDTAVVQLRTAGGIVIQSLASLASVEEDRVEIYGERGKLVVDRYQSFDAMVPVRARGRVEAALAATVQGVRRTPYMLRRMRAPWHEPSYRHALEHFVASVRAGSAPSPSLVDGYECAVLVDAAECAARERRSVTIATHGDPSVVTRGVAAG